MEFVLDRSFEFSNSLIYLNINTVRLYVIVSRGNDLFDDNSCTDSTQLPSGRLIINE